MDGMGLGTDGYRLTVVSAAGADAGPFRVPAMSLIEQRRLIERARDGAAEQQERQEAS